MPVPDLNLGDINVLVVTDTHSFIGGHPHEPNADADLGDVLSFYERLKAWCNEQGSDLWFVMNGDIIHGTGLAMDGNASSLIPLLNHMPWDAINIGNHEAYYTETIESMRDAMIPNFGKETFVTSNVMLSDTKEPFGTRYNLLTGVNNTLLVFGFLYDMKDPTDLLQIDKVEDVLEESWFQEALKTEQYDAILVMAHMGNEDNLIHKIFKAIRAHVGDDMPIQFVTGHTHHRASAKVDLWSYAMEAGGDLDTVGFVSFPTHTTAQSVEKKGQAHNYFHSEFLNASKLVLAQVLDADGNVDDLHTENGTALSHLIKETQSALGLEDVVACPPRDYFKDISIFDRNSLWKLWQDHVAPSQIFNKNPLAAMIVSSDEWRYDLLTGAKHKDKITVDDVVAIAPFMEPVIYVGKVPLWALSRMNNSLNTYSHHDALVPDYVLSAEILKEDLYTQKGLMYDLYTHQYNLDEILSHLKRFNVNDLENKKTGDRDTLYWIRYLEQAFPCGGKFTTEVHPWFENTNELEDETTDGKRSSDDEEKQFVDDYNDDDIDIDNDNDNGDDCNTNSNVSGDSGGQAGGQGYQGYLPPAVAEKYNVAPPSLSPCPSKGKGKGKGKVDQQDKFAQAQASKLQKKKVRKTIIKVVAIVIAVALLVVPLCCCFVGLTGNDDDDENEMIYDPEEVAALKSGKKKVRNRRQPQPSEIEITTGGGRIV